MKDLTQEEQKLLAKHLNVYIKEKRTQEECSGFIDGFKLALIEVKTLGSVSKRLDKEYAKGWNEAIEEIKEQAKHIK